VSGGRAAEAQGGDPHGDAARDRCDQQSVAGLLGAVQWRHGRDQVGGQGPNKRQGGGVA